MARRVDKYKKKAAETLDVRINKFDILNGSGSVNMFSKGAGFWDNVLFDVPAFNTYIPGPAPPVD